MSQFYNFIKPNSQMRWTHTKIFDILNKKATHDIQIRCYITVHLQTCQKNLEEPQES
jgi:hypothetical protein